MAAYPETEPTRIIPPYIAPTGTPGPGTDHTTLSNLTWSASGHTGIANWLAGFNGSGTATYFQLGVDVMAYDADLQQLADLAPADGEMLLRSGGAWISTVISSGDLGALSTSGGTITGDLDITGYLTLDNYLILTELISSPATPPGGSAYFYVKTDGKLYYKNDSGTEYDLTAAGSGSDTTLRQVVELSSLWKTALATGYRELTYTSGDLTQVDVWEDSGKATKLFTRVLTYTLGNLTQVLTTDNLTSSTQTKILTYDIDGDLETVTTTIA